MYGPYKFDCSALQLMSLVIYSLEAELDIWLSQDPISTMNGLKLTCDIVFAMPDGMITPVGLASHTSMVDIQRLLFHFLFSRRPAQAFTRLGEIYVYSVSTWLEVYSIHLGPPARDLLILILITDTLDGPSLGIPETPLPPSVREHASDYGLPWISLVDVCYMFRGSCSHERCIANC